MTATKKGFVAATSRPAAQPLPVEPADIYALQAMNRCEATPDQQRRCVLWLKKASRCAENPYRPGADEGRRDTDFLCGMKFVGDQFVSIINSTVQESRQA